MNTLGLGRPVQSFWLGLPYADIVIEEPSPHGAGGNYGRPLPSLWDYEQRIKKLLDEERAQRLNEAKRLKKRLIQIEMQKMLVAQQEEDRKKLEIELSLEVVSESLLQVERDLVEIDRKRAAIKLKARIMRDDDEIMLILYG